MKASDSFRVNKLQVLFKKEREAAQEKVRCVFNNICLLEEAAKEGLTAAFGRFNDRKDYTMERKRWCLEAQQRAQERKQQQELLAMDTVDVNENNAIVEPDYFKFFQNDQKKTWF